MREEGSGGCVGIEFSHVLVFMLMPWVTKPRDNHLFGQPSGVL